MLAVSMNLYWDGTVSFNAVLICTVAMLGSFGPVSALSALSNNLTQTLASGNRVLNLLEEEPVVEDVTDGAAAADGVDCGRASRLYLQRNGRQYTPCLFGFFGRI